MKLNRKGVGAAALILCTALLASCAVEASDTTANFSEVEKTVTTSRSSSSYKVKSGIVSNVSGGTLMVGGWQTVSFNIESYAKLDLASLEAAVKFYSLKDNNNDASYYPMHDELLAKKLVNTTESVGTMSNYDTGIITTVEYDVDLTKVVTSKIALIVDAANLKDRSGNPVLNLDSDDNAGEETDSYIIYISTSGKEALHYNYSEDFDPSDKLSGYFPSAGSWLLDSDGKRTGKLRFTAYAPVTSEPIAATSVYDSTWAETLNRIVVFQTKAANETEWNDIPVTFVYHAVSDTTNPYAEIAKYTVTADTPALEHGTKYRVIVKTVPNIPGLAWFSKVYGHEGYLFTESKEYKLDADTLGYGTFSGTSYVFLTSPNYIVKSYDSSAMYEVDWVPEIISKTTISNIQNNLFSVTEKRTSARSDAWEWEITPASDCILSAAEDFVVTDHNYSKLDAKVTVFKNSKDIIAKVYVELTNKDYRSTNGNPILWVGHGTKLEYNIAYPKQLEFGTYASSEYPSIISDYVKLTADSSSYK